MAKKSLWAIENKKNNSKFDLFNQLLLVVTAASVTTIPFIFDSFTVSKLFVLAVGLTYISVHLYRSSSDASNGKIPKMLVALISLLLISMLVSWSISGVPLTRALIGQFGRGNGLFYYFFAILIFSFAVKTYRGSSRLQMHRLITGLSWFMVVYAALQRIGIDIAKLDTRDLSPVVLTFGNSNFAGGMLSVLFAYHLTYTFISKSYRLKEFALLVSILISTTFPAAVQGYLIVLFSFVLVASMILRREFTSVWVSRGLVVAWSLSLFSVILGVFGKFIFAGVFSRGTFQIRVEYWSIALNIIQDFPLFGVGPDRLYDVSSNYMAPGTLKLVTRTRLDNAHNWYLNFGVNFGLISLFFLLAIFGLVFLASYRLLKNLEVDNAVALSSMVAFLAMFIDGLVSLEQPGIGVWLYLFAGVVIGASLDSSRKNLNQESRNNPAKISPPLLQNTIAATVAVLLTLSSMILGNRIVFDGILRSNVQTALLNKGSPQTFSSIESAVIKLQSDPEYAAQALKPLAAVGNGIALDAVSRAFYDYYPDSIQATLIRADVLRALDREKESCPLRTTIVKNIPWDFDQVGKYVDCYMGGYVDPNLVNNLKLAAQFFYAIDESKIPSGTDEISKKDEVFNLSSRLNVISINSRVLLILGQSESAQKMQAYGNSLLSRLTDLKISNPDLVSDSQIAYFAKLLNSK